MAAGLQGRIKSYDRLYRSTVENGQRSSIGTFRTEPLLLQRKGEQSLHFIELEIVKLVLGVGAIIFSTQ